MRVTVIATAAALTLSACASYAPPAREPDPAARTFQSRDLNDPLLMALVTDSPESRAIEWNLDTLTRAAIYLNPELEAARAKWRAGQAAIQTADRRANPTLDASVGRATNPPPGEPAGLVDMALGLRVETAGKRRERMTQATALSESDGLELQAAAWQLRGRIRNSLLDWSAAVHEESLLSQQVEVDRAVARMLELRVQLGEAAMGEKVRADAALARTLLDKRAAASRVIDARTRLAQAVGVPVAAIEEVQVHLDLEATATVAEKIGSDLRRAALKRDDLRAALARYTAADAAYRLEIAKQYPDLEFGPSYSYDAGTHKISFGVMSLIVPVLDRNQGAIAEARARRDEAVARFETLQASALTQLDRAIAGEHEARERFALASEIVGRERVQLEQTSRRFTAGEEDRLALASAKRALNDAERAALAARLAVQKSFGVIEDSTRIPLFASPGSATRDLVENGGLR